MFPVSTKAKDMDPSAHPVEDYFYNLSMHLVYDMYKRDFDLFKYDAQDPSNKMPIGEIDLDEVHAKLGD